MKEKLLSREVKQDKKGIYFSYGGYRFRPFKKTLSYPGFVIEFESPFHRMDAFVKVFVNGRREIWKQTLAPTEYSIHRGKTIRLGQHYYGWKSFPLVCLVKK